MWSNCPSSNPAGPAPMIATFVRNTCSLDCYTFEAGRSRRWPSQLALVIISYNNICKGPSKPGCRKGRRVDEENAPGAAGGRQRVACVRAGEEFRTETLALGAGFASAAKGARGLGRRGREGFRRHHQIQGLPGAAARQGL